jgi:lipoyl-dependent peroxiredoxin
MKTLYTAQAIVVGGRNGHAETSDKRIDVDLIPPGTNKPGTNAEQLFACGYASCFGSALIHVAGLQKIEVGDVKVLTEVDLNQDEQGFSLAVRINVLLPNLDQPTSEQLVLTADQICPYSKATRGNIILILQANGQILNQ